MSAVQEALGAGAGAAVSTLVFFPLELLKTRLQARIGCSATGMELLKEIVAKEGVMGLFRGCPPVLVRAVTMDSLFFLIDFKLSEIVQKIVERDLFSIEGIAIGFLSACLTQVVVHPLDTVTARIMADEKNQPFQTHLEAAFRAGLWKGYGKSMILSLNPALQFAIFDRCKKSLAEYVGGQEKISAAQIFLLGMGTKAFSLSLIYPLIRAKVRAQVDENEETLIQSLREIIEVEGVLGLYKGLKEQLGKSTLSTALLLTVKEEISRLISIILKRSRELKMRQGYVH